jgi:hypothetical protein
MLQKRPNCLLFQNSLPKYLKSQKERFRAIFDQINSIPGLNDPLKVVHFSPHQHFWKLIENDVFEAVQQFFTNGKVPKGCNSSFIALIPKIPDANLIKDFRPITLIGSMYKIIAKVLANPLVGVLGDIVDEVQSAIITDRKILDGPFILNEVLQWCKLKKKQSLIFKVDFEKAYDSVR